MWKGIYIILFCVGMLTVVQSEVSRRGEVSKKKTEFVSLKPDVVYDSTNYDFKTDTLCIYCYGGEARALWKFFTTATIRINIQTEDFQLYDGDNFTVVLKNFETAENAWFNMMPWKQTVVQIHPFTSSCIGVATDYEHETRLLVKRIDFKRIFQFAGGLLLFLYSGQIGHNAIFYYSVGTSVGVLAAGLILVFILSRMFPRKPIAYTILIGGSSITLYILQLLYNNMLSLIKRFHFYIIGYLSIASIISFCLIYRYQPMTHPRSLQLVTWSMQALGLVFMLSSSCFREASLAVIILVVTIHNIPAQWTRRLKNLWYVKFPPKRRFLSEEEYYEQGVRETARSLKDLQRYCASPECPSWKIIRKIKDPKRFAEFVSGASHLNDEEILDHELFSPLHDRYEDPKMDGKACYFNDSDELTDSLLTDDEDNS